MELKVIENDLVPVYETDKGEKVVYGTELHKALDVKSNYREWVIRRFNDCDSQENKDFQGVEISTSSGQLQKEHIIKLDTAKEMAMLERNEKGKQVRRYFITVEDKYKQSSIAISELSEELQMFNRIFQSVAKNEIELKRQAEKIERIESNQKFISDTMTTDPGESFRMFVKQSITSVAESPNYTKGESRHEKYKYATQESYDLLNDRKPCRLKQRVNSEKRRAMDSGMSKTKANQITKLTIIENDKALKPIYIAILKEMAIKYCVDIGGVVNA